MATECCFAILCRMCDSLIDRTWRFCCGLPCCNCECPCCSTNQCQEMTCQFHFCEPELDEDYEPGNLHEVKVTATRATYTCEDLDSACMVCCRYLSCVPCCAFVCKKCSNSHHCPNCLHSNCCLAKDRDILKEMEVLENSIPGAYRNSSTTQKKSKDSHLYPKESTGKTYLVSADNTSIHGNDSKTSSLRSKAESEEEEMNREDGHYRNSDRAKNEKTITAIIEQPHSVALHGTTDSVTIAREMTTDHTATSSGTATESIQNKSRKLARSMDSIEFDRLLDSDSEIDGLSGYHGNKTTSNVKVNYRDVCLNGVEIIVTDYDYGKKRTDSISSESSVENEQTEQNQEVVEQEMDSSSGSVDTLGGNQCNEDIYKPVVIETKNILITSHRQTSV